jgi:hypothetical protein
MGPRDPKAIYEDYGRSGSPKGPIPGSFSPTLGTFPLARRAPTAPSQYEMLDANSYIDTQATPDARAARAHQAALREELAKFAFEHDYTRGGAASDKSAERTRKIADLVKISGVTPEIAGVIADNPALADNLIPGAHREQGPVPGSEAWYLMKEREAGITARHRRPTGGGSSGDAQDRIATHQAFGAVAAQHKEALARVDAINKEIDKLPDPVTPTDSAQERKSVGPWSHRRTLETLRDTLAAHADSLAHVRDQLAGKLTEAAGGAGAAAAPATGPVVTPATSPDFKAQSVLLQKAHDDYIARGGDPTLAQERLDLLMGNLRKHFDHAQRGKKQ